MGIIYQPENRSVEESDQPDGILSKRKSLTDFVHNVGANCVRPKGTLSKRKSLTSLVVLVFGLVAQIRL